MTAPTKDQIAKVERFAKKYSDGSQLDETVVTGNKVELCARISDEFFTSNEEDDDCPDFNDKALEKAFKKFMGDMSEKYESIATWHNEKRWVSIVVEFPTVKAAKTSAAKPAAKKAVKAVKATAPVATVTESLKDIKTMADFERITAGKKLYRKVDGALVNASEEVESSKEQNKGLLRKFTLNNGKSPLCAVQHLHRFYTLD